MTLSKVALALIAFAAAAPAQSPASQDVYSPAREIIVDIGRIVTPNGIQETFEAQLGGVRQVVNVRGADRSNPILLFIHGGPGSVEMPIAWSFQRPWEDFFTVVQWDQRAAGRSFPLTDPAKVAPTLTPARYRDDAIELIELLTRKYNQRKVLVVGHSWGSAIGLFVAAKRPDLLHAYIGIGQLIDSRENEQVGFEWTLARARERGDADAVRELEALRPYPGDGPLDVKKMTIERKWNVRFGALAAHRSDANFYFRAARISPEYSPADRKAWDAGSEFTIKALWPHLATISFKNQKRLQVPIFLFLGRHDYTTPSPIAAAWLDRLAAPQKKAIWFEHSAHLPMLEEPGRVLLALVHHARPLATGSKAESE